MDYAVRHAIYITTYTTFLAQQCAIIRMTTQLESSQSNKSDVLFALGTCAYVIHEFCASHAAPAWPWRMYIATTMNAELSDSTQTSH